MLTVIRFENTVVKLFWFRDFPYMVVGKLLLVGKITKPEVKTAI